MSRGIAHTFGEALKSLFISLLKLAAICFAWFCKLCGMLLTRIGEAIENAISK